jgi:hypothetical protein
MVRLSLLPASFWFLTWLILRSWRWRWHVPPKLRLAFKGLQDAVVQKKTVTFKIRIVLRASRWLVCEFYLPDDKAARMLDIFRLHVWLRHQVPKDGSSSPITWQDGTCQLDSLDRGILYPRMALMVIGTDQPLKRHVSVWAPTHPVSPQRFGYINHKYQSWTGGLSHQLLNI